LDLSCGDGLLMFLHLGGVFDVDFDYFQSTAADKFKHSKFIGIYNVYNENYKVNIIKKTICNN